MGNYVYKIVVNHYNKQEVLEIIHIVAGDFLEAAFITESFVFEQVRYPDTPAEIASISRVMEITNILNANISRGQEEIDNPFAVLNAEEEDVINFKHTPCGNQVSILESGWNKANCPDCGRTFLRNQLEQIAGTWIFKG